MSSIVRYIRFGLLLLRSFCPTTPCPALHLPHGATTADMGALSLQGLLSEHNMLISILSAVMSGALLRHTWTNPTHGDRGSPRELHLMF